MMQPSLRHRPVRQRSPLLDSLRALALFGVLVMNLSAMNMRFVGAELMAGAGPLDFGALWLDLALFQGKARAAFAFLFGVGFTILMMRAEAKGADFRAFYIRRMLALLAFGIINQLFLFWGDILCLYAILGLVLLPLRGLNDRATLRAGIFLVLVPPIVIGLLEILTGPLPSLLPSDRTADTAWGVAALTSPSYLDAVAFNAPQQILRYATDTAHMAGYVTAVLGLFLLGSWTARRGILFDPNSHRRLLRSVARWCLPVGAALSLVYATRFGGIRAEGAWLGIVTAASVGLPILALGYIAALALLFERRAKALQAFLAPAGRMALTNYLLSGMIGGWLFYGYGLGAMGSLNLAEINLFAFGLFLALAGLSHLWLRRFAFGPAETLWRRLSYGPARPAARADALTAEPGF
jgi:uncharacterized protein